MNRIITTLSALASAWSVTAADSLIGTKPIAPSPVTSNYVAIVTGYGTTATFRLLPLTNAFTVLGNLSPRIDTDFRFYDALYVSGDLTVTQQVVAASFVASGEVAAESFRVTGTGGGALSLNATNATGKAEWSIHKDNMQKVTNVVGLAHASAASVLEMDFRKGNDFSATNRISADTACVLTNGADGQEIGGTILGNASTSYAVTFIANTGQLVASLDDFNAALAASLSQTLTNGNALEWSAKINRLNGTNVIKIVSRQFKF